MRRVAPHIRPALGLTLALVWVALVVAAVVASLWAVFTDWGPLAPAVLEGCARGFSEVGFVPWAEGVLRAALGWVARILVFMGAICYVLHLIVADAADPDHSNDGVRAQVWVAALPLALGWLAALFLYLIPC